jgi:thioredoxin 1
MALIALAACGMVGLVRPAAALPDIYPAPEQAKTDLASALKDARSGHRRVILDFGGNWCTDCHVLDSYLHDPANQPLVDKGFIVVHVNIGQRDQNLDIAEHYKIPLNKGVPALAVLDSRGRLLYSQTGGEFEDMRHMDLNSVTEFLKRWQPKG